MTNVVNLNKFRKEKLRREKSKKADENRHKFGRTKSEKSEDDQQRKKTIDVIDAHKLDDDQES